jgi:hypothetical protein
MAEEPTDLSRPVAVVNAEARLDAEVRALFHARVFASADGAPAFLPRQQRAVLLRRNAMASFEMASALSLGVFTRC